MAGPSAEPAGLESKATTEAPVGHPVAGPEPLTAAPIAQRVLALQRAAGNRAVASLIGRQGVTGLAPPGARWLTRQPTPTLPKAPASPPAACGTEWRPPTDPERFLEFRGEIEHFITQMDFMTRPGARAEYSIPAASKSGSGRTGYADAVDTVTNEIWEIKPEHLQTLAVTEADRYVTYADAACAPRNWKPGTSYSPKTDPLWPPPGVVDLGFRLRARQGDAGAILYKWEFGKELLEAFALSLLIKFAARAIKDAVFGRDSAVDPGKVPAPAYAPYQ
jgi:hypothetical protein